MNILRNAYYNIKNGIKNLVYWFSVIWKDNDWDDHFIYTLLKKKLENMEIAFRSNKAMSANALKDADNMRYTINLLDRIINNVYLEEAMKPFDEKYPEYDYEDEFRYSRLIDKDTPEQKALKTKCYEESYRLEEKDFDNLFKFLREHIREWWD